MELREFHWPFWLCLIRQVGIEPTTSCLEGRHSSNWVTSVKGFSGTWFRSKDLQVMGLAHCLCATPLLIDWEKPCGHEEKLPSIVVFCLNNLLYLAVCFLYCSENLTKYLQRGGKNREHLIRTQHIHTYTHTHIHTYTHTHAHKQQTANSKQIQNSP